MVWYLYRCALAVVLSAPNILLAAEPLPLSLQSAIELAVSQSRLIHAGHFQASSAREMGRAAAQLPDPVLKFSINNLPIDGADRFSVARDFMTMRSVGVMQDFVREDKRLARAARFEREAETAEANRVLAAMSVSRNTATAWLDRYFQEQMLELLVRQRNEVKLQIDASEAAYRGVRGSQSDVFVARLALTQIDDRVLASERQVATAKSRLARWIGAEAAQGLGDLPRLDVLPLKDASLERQILMHPQVAVLIRQEEMALAEVLLAQANKKADWSAEVMLSLRGPTYSNMISINLSLPLQGDQKNRQDRELAAKQANVLQLRAEREDAVLAFVIEARASLQEWESNRARLKRYDDSIIPITALRTQATITAYRGGTNTVTLSAVLEARRSEIDVRMERLRLDMDTARLWAQLNYLIDPITSKE